MLLIAAALIAGMPAVQGAAQGAFSPGLATEKNCPRTSAYTAWQRGKPVRPQKLNELPPGNMYSAVYRRIGECEVPIVVRYGVGGR